MTVHELTQDRARESEEQHRAQSLLSYVIGGALSVAFAVAQTVTAELLDEKRRGHREVRAAVITGGIAAEEQRHGAHLRESQAAVGTHGWEASDQMASL